MNTVSGALIAAGASFVTVLLLRLLLPGRGGLGSLLRFEQETEEGGKLGGIFYLGGLLIGLLVGGGSFSGNALFSLLITAAFVLIGFADDLTALQDKRGEGIVPWLKGLLILFVAVCAALYLSLSNVSGRTQCLPVSYASSDLKGWFILFALPLLLGRTVSAEKMHESVGRSFSSDGYEAVFWCFVFCIAGESGTGKWLGYRSEFSGMAAFCGAAAGALLGLSVFDPGSRALPPGKSGHYGIAASLTLAELCSGWLILLPLAALWPFISFIFALITRILALRKGKSPESYLLADYFLSRRMAPERLLSTVRWISLIGVLLAAVLYVL